MQITCFNDHYTWTLNPLNIGAGKLKLALGFRDITFYCPKCHKGNVVTKAEFEAAVNGPQPGGQLGGGVSGKAGPARPATGAGPSIPGQQKSGVVIVRSLHVRKDHSTRAETVAGLVRGDKVTVLNTWSDGKNTWAQLGPDRWAAIVYNDEPLIELSN
jgi:hypothetical protein